MKQYYAAIIKIKKSPAHTLAKKLAKRLNVRRQDSRAAFVIWGCGTTEFAALRDAKHWIKGWWMWSHKKNKQLIEIKKLKIVRITKNVKDKVDEIGGHNITLKKSNGVYDLNGPQKNWLG